MEGLLRRYAHLPMGTRLFLWLRWLWTPYDRMASLLPDRGLVLDGGCGHGLLSLTLALGSSRRRVEGLDHSVERVAIARQAGRDLPNLSVSKGDFRKIPRRAYQGIALVDVLHYLPYEEQEALMKDAFRRLARGGVFLFRDVDRRPGFSSLWNRLHEGLMTGLGFTKAGGLHFRSRVQWDQLARRVGFQVRSEATGRFPFADVLFWCRKP
ncbi:MAG TPA: class I SAM-dependent methyltransferase [bacterium]|nr:class I SAM-dependent methyltransferase [bacterium]